MVVEAQAHKFHVLLSLQAELDRSEAAAATGAAAHPDLQQPSQHRHRSKQGSGGRGDAAAAVRRTRSSNSACETIREDREEEVQPGDGDKQQRRSNTLRDRYTASVAVPKQLTQADQAVYERVRALHQGSSSHSDDVQHHAQPLKHSSNDSDAGGSINCSDDTACECAPQANHAQADPNQCAMPVPLGYAHV